MNSVQKTFAGFVPTSTASAHGKAVPNIFLNKIPQLGNKEANNGLQENLTVDLQFLEDILQIQNTLFRIPRDRLVLQRSKYQQHPKESKLTYVVVIFFFTNQAAGGTALKQLLKLPSGEHILASQLPVEKKKLFFTTLTIMKKNQTTGKI